ncbi:MAG: hypothetical protein ABEH78_00280 [Haloferacaceae archaeon]
MPRFEYPCPDCRTTNSLHETGCDFEGVEWARIEDAYLDVVAPLATGVRSEDDLRERWAAAATADAAATGGGTAGAPPDRTVEGDPPAAVGRSRGPGRRDDADGPGAGPGARAGAADVDPVALRGAALARLKREGRVDEHDGRLRLLTAEEFREEVAEPTHEPLATLHRHGSVPGCHDNAVFAMIAWYEMVGLSWTETRERVVEWLEESGAWDRGGFEESTPAELVDKKRHVYEAGYGWKEKAQAAKRVIERRS